ncbi:AraC family transcriptional regulator [Sphaerimonospora sp. CA-214678]|uniref:AraC family transcriptional regulator n=1 Tax=Sphaerimonospora sp. CA-214678 TaxID=3240029 RepID=UPI003D8B71F0
MPARPLPLATYERFRTRDLDEARTQVADAFFPHELSIAKRETRIDARMNGTSFGSTGLYFMDYGGEVLIAADEWESCFVVPIPLAGAAQVSHRGERIVTTPELGFVLSPTERVSMHWEAGTPHLVAWFDRAALEAHLGRLLGWEPHRRLVFSLGMDLTRPLARSWLSVVDMIRREAETGGDMLGRPLVLNQVEELLMTQLLLTQVNNYTPALAEEPPRAAPAAVKRAMELIEAHAARPVTMADIAVAVGLDARALRDGFRRHLDTTPTAYLREVRLERARAELRLRGPGGTTVADVARRWGFVDPGRFSRAYRRHFGETPSRTLRG